MCDLVSISSTFNENAAKAKKMEREKKSEKND